VKTPRATRRSGILAAVCAAGASLVLGACNIVAPLGYIVHGPEKVAAAYTLDPKKTTVLFIDDTRSSVLPSRAVRTKIGQSGEAVLLNDAKIERMLSSRDIMSVADREKYSRQMGIVELGEAVDADVIIYVTMESFALVQEGENYKPISACRIRVVDVREKKQIFPEEIAKWHPLVVEAPPRTGGMPASNSDRNKVYLEFAERVGTAIGNVFVKHEERPQTGRLDH
jgi:hypothetical protein